MEPEKFDEVFLEELRASSETIELSDEAWGVLMKCFIRPEPEIQVLPDVILD
jgi:hypothetical protein